MTTHSITAQQLNEIAVHVDAILRAGTSASGAHRAIAIMMLLEKIAEAPAAGDESGNPNAKVVDFKPAAKDGSASQ